MFNMKVIAREQQQTSSWSGGTTTQLAIYPEASSYIDRNFLWRLSTAVVEVEESCFTKLQGFYRRLMVLEGELELVHKEHHSIKLMPYEQDSFKGDWDTTGYGKARDFNLMLKEGLTGELKQFTVNEKFKLSIEAAAENNFYALYCFKGAAYIKGEEESAEIMSGDMLLINYNRATELEVCSEASEACVLICANISI
jgi:environmental stress-induced protein Ves